MSSPLLQTPGAVPAEGADAGVAWHYGEPVREQRLLEEGLAVVDLSYRGVVRVTGPDRLRWLDSVISQQVSALEPGRSTESLILSPSGRIEHALRLVDDGDATWILVEPGQRESLVAWLDSMRFMLRVEVADVTDSWAVIGEPTDRRAAPGEPVTWVDPWPATAPGSAAYGPPDAQHPGSSRAWREVVVPRQRLREAVADRPLAGTWAAEALRVAAWRPRWGFETDEKTIPHEIDWLRTAVHMAKGCYRGQETVAKVYNLGRPPRRLVALHLDGTPSVLPAPGGLVTDAAGREVGRLTSSARHHELGPIGLALVKRSVPLEVSLAVDGVAAAQEQIVDPDAGRLVIRERPGVPARGAAGRL